MLKEQKTKNTLFISVLVALVMVMSACAPLSAVANLPLVGSSSNDSSSASNSPQTSSQSSSSAVVDVNPVSVAALEGTLGDIYRQVGPSVVNIQVTSSGLATSTPFDQNGNQLPNVQSALGSGFVWDKEGHIVTNNHVVEGATKIEVVFADGTTYSAELVGADKDSDLAVVKIAADASVLQPVQVADSTAVQVGDLAIAIGNPYGLGGTMTVGIISALGRSLQTDNTSMTGSYTIPDIIQTDAAINPGNSGGVLLDSAGQVIGVTAAIESPVQANVGIGFVIPSAIVKNVVPELISNGTYEHSYLGISGGTLIPDIADAMNLDHNQRGILIATVTDGGPAADAGLKGSDKVFSLDGYDVNIGGDIITAIDGTSTPTFDDLVSFLASSTKPGQTVTLDILRDGKTQQVKVKLAARPAQEQASTNNPPTSAFVSGNAYLGITGGSLAAAINEAMNLDANQEGVLVVEVAANSPASDAGLKGSTETITVNGQDIQIGGDVITKINDASISGIQNLRTELGKYSPGDEVTLTILRDGKEMQVKVTLAERP